ncbi:MAG: DUF1579 domain-containing protein [Alphaproteobacteria bacterium]|nr:DUF1579 domain-containing protein [Alphaproteobacteria bacterium]MDE2631223.1 DUF1579 domain-containing protein [Alphaproteobacteria bacterium]
MKIAAAPVTGGTTLTDHAHDFDFLIGKWRVHHRRLKERLANNHEWVEFEGMSELQMTMGGHGTMDDNFVGLPGGAYRAMGMRGYDPKTQTWAIWWLDARDPHTIGSPVIGNFKNGIGTFDGDDTFNGKSIKVRFVWSCITANSGHWEQAFSPDGGKSWETNWVMDFTRVK